MLIKNKWMKNAALTILIVVFLIACFIALNLYLDKLDITPIDFTQDKRYSITDDTKNQIKDIEQNVTIYFFGYEDSSSAVTIAKQYQDVNDKIRVLNVKASENPELATKFGVSSESQIIAVTSNQRNKIIDSSETYTYDSSTGKTIDITEQKITNAILDVTIEKKPQVYFLTGHEEGGITDDNTYLSQFITNEVYDVNSLDLLTSDMPEVCDVLIISDPKKDFSSVETEKIKNYIKNGGKIIWLQNPYITTVENYTSSTFPNINSVLAEYGISFSKGIVCEESADNVVSNSPDIIIPELTYNEIVKDIYTDGKIIMMDAGKITNESDEKMEELGVTASAFVKTSDKAYYKEKFDSQNGSLSKSSDDETGSFILGETLEKKINDDKTSTLVAYSNAYFVSNKGMYIGNNAYTYPISLRNNKDIILNTVAYLSKREDSIRIRKDVGLVSFDTPTEKQNAIVQIIVFGIPILIIIIGIIVSIVRRHRK